MFVCARTRVSARAPARADKGGEVVGVVVVVVVGGRLVDGAGGEDAQPLAHPRPGPGRQRPEFARVRAHA